VKWAYHNPQTVFDYFITASHLTALAGKAIAQSYYGRAPVKSYFMGCSAGGMQAMWLAERFAWDFDGIAAGSPCPHLSASWMNMLWGNRALTDANGEPLMRQADLELLHQSVVAKCDLNDGVRDGLIGDPRPKNCVAARGIKDNASRRGKSRPSERSTAARLHHETSRSCRPLLSEGLSSHGYFGLWVSMEGRTMLQNGSAIIFSNLTPARRGRQAILISIATTSA
jgi:hypothetical protein